MVRGCQDLVDVAVRIFLALLVVIVILLGGLGVLFRF